MIFLNEVTHMQLFVIVRDYLLGHKDLAVCAEVMAA